MSLTFDDLRAANKRRVSLFKNRAGEPAHKAPDGSDWRPEQWLQAMIGEVGEFAEALLELRSGKIGLTEYRVRAAKELADIQTYLDLLAMRALDIHNHPPTDHAFVLTRALALLGKHADARNKFERGDGLSPPLGRIIAMYPLMTALANSSTLKLTDNGSSEPDPWGINLGSATRDKFNEVSDRCGTPEVRL